MCGGFLRFYLVNILFITCHHTLFIIMGNRYLKSENETLRSMYSYATKAEIMAKLPGRNWIAVSKYAQHKLGLYRSKKAKEDAVRLEHSQSKKAKEVVVQEGRWKIWEIPFSRPRICREAVQEWREKMIKKEGNIRE